MTIWYLPFTLSYHVVMFMFRIWDAELMIASLSSYDFPPTSHHIDVIMGAMATQITSLTIVYSTVYSGAHQRKHQSSASLAFVRGIHQGPVNSPHKEPVTRKIFPFDDVILSPHLRFSQSRIRALGLHHVACLCATSFSPFSSWTRT